MLGFRVLEALRVVSNLRTLTLWVRRSLNSYSVSTPSADKNYDSAASIMQNLHGRKVGVSFEKITIILFDCIAPRSAQEGIFPNNKALGREFSSRIIEIGVYEQWGSDRIGPSPL